MSNINGTNIASAIAPFTSEDKYPTHSAIYGKGGHRTVYTLSDRNNITIARRELLMTVAVIEDGKTYKLIHNPETENTISTDWELVNGSFNYNIIDVDPENDAIILNKNGLYKSSNLNSCQVALNIVDRYGKIMWCVEIADNLPNLTFSNRILWRYDNDLEFTPNSIIVFEFETWDQGVTWLGKVSKYSFTTPENFITENDINSIFGWQQV